MNLFTAACYSGSFDLIEVENDSRQYCLGKEESVGYTRLFVGVCENKEAGGTGVPVYVIIIIMLLIVYILPSSS